MPRGCDGYKNLSDSYNASSLYPTNNMSSFEDLECGVIPDIERIKVGQLYSYTDLSKNIFTQHQSGFVFENCFSNFTMEKVYNPSLFLPFLQYIFFV